MNADVYAIAPLIMPGMIQLPSSWLLLVPAYLAIFCAVLVILTAIAIFLRVIVYQNLTSIAHRVRKLIHQESLRKKPQIVEEIEHRLQQCLPILDQINTTALVEQVYSQNLSKNQQLDYFCRLLPNLLLAFGLLGTFLGITMNLNELSQTINEFGMSSIDDLVQQVQRPLQGMGVAFISSLTAVSCSVLLNLVNLFRNTNVARYQLLSALEDYVDNVYIPSLGHKNPMERAVDRLEEFFQRFTHEFGISVRQAVEQSLGEKVTAIMDGNREANHLANQVYTRFLESAGAMKSGATIFRESANIFERSQFAHKLASSMESLVTTQRELSRSAGILNQSTQSIQMAIAALQSSNAEMVRLSEQINLSTKQSSEVLGMTQANQYSLGDVVNQLQQASHIFHSVIRTLDLLQKRLDTRADRLINVHAELSKLIEVMQDYTEDVTVNLQTMGDRLVVAINETGAVSHSQKQEVVTKISQLGSDLNLVKSHLAELVQNLSNHPQTGDSAPTQISYPPESPNQ